MNSRSNNFYTYSSYFADRICINNSEALLGWWEEAEDRTYLGKQEEFIFRHLAFPHCVLHYQFLFSTRWCSEIAIWGWPTSR